VDLLEGGDLPLEDALRRYEEGLLAIQRCREILDGAERRIEVLSRDIGCVVDGAGGPVWKPAASFPQLREALEALERGDGGPAPPAQPATQGSPGGPAGGPERAGGR
jgi:exodeoxyribonuclease VII small subunit